MTPLDHAVRDMSDAILNRWRTWTGD